MASNLLNPDYHQSKPDTFNCYTTVVFIYNIGHLYAPTHIHTMNQNCKPLLIFVFILKKQHPGNNGYRTQPLWKQDCNQVVKNNWSYRWWTVQTQHICRPALSLLCKPGLKYQLLRGNPPPRLTHQNFRCPSKFKLYQILSKLGSLKLQVHAWIGASESNGYHFYRCCKTR